MTMQDHETAAPTAPKRTLWNKGKLTGAKPPLRPKHVWSIRTRLQIDGRTRDLAMFNLAIDKSFNDRFGHAPRRPRAQAYRLDHHITVRSNDLVFRFGGEEFVVICDGMAADPALALGERIRREVAGSEDGASQVAVSVG